MDYFSKKTRNWIYAVLPIVFGTLMLIDPNASESASSNQVYERGRLFKIIINQIWGIPFGIILILLGVFLIYRLIKYPHLSEDEES